MIAFIKGILADMDESGVVLERDGSDMRFSLR